MQGNVSAKCDRFHGMILLRFPRIQAQLKGTKLAGEDRFQKERQSPGRPTTNTALGLSLPGLSLTGLLATTECVTYSDYRSKMIIFESILTTPEAAGWGSEN